MEKGLPSPETPQLVALEEAEGALAHCMHLSLAKYGLQRIG